MPEHTPAPTPHRAVYGFAVFLLFKTLFFVWLIWAFVPDYILRDHFGLTYLPDKYFAIQLPVIVLCGLFFFAFCIYPAWNLSMTNDCDDVSAVADKYSIHRCTFQSTNGKLCDRRIVHDIMSGWQVEKFCGHHQMAGKNSECNNIKIENFCDCPDRAKCLLGNSPNHVLMLRELKTVPSVCDLDISAVCKAIFRDKYK